jgi:hypothetical protein
MGFAIAEQGCLYIRTRWQAVWKAVITAGNTLGGPDFRPCWMRFNAKGSRVRIAVQVRMTIGGYRVVRRFRFHPYPPKTLPDQFPRRGEHRGWSVSCRKPSSFRKRSAIPTSWSSSRRQCADHDRPRRRARRLAEDREWDGRGGLMMGDVLVKSDIAVRLLAYGC